MAGVNRQTTKLLEFVYTFDEQMDTPHLPKWVQVEILTLRETMDFTRREFARHNFPLRSLLDAKYEQKPKDVLREDRLG